MRSMFLPWSWLRLRRSRRAAMAITVRSMVESDSDAAISIRRSMRASSAKVDGILASLMAAADMPGPAAANISQ